MKAKGEKTGKQDGNGQTGKGTPASLFRGLSIERVTLSGAGWRSMPQKCFLNRK